MPFKRMSALERMCSQCDLGTFRWKFGIFLEAHPTRGKIKRYLVGDIYCSCLLSIQC